MRRNQDKISVVGMVILLLILVNVIILKYAFVSDPVWYKVGYVTFPLMMVLIAVHQTKGIRKKRKTLKQVLKPAF